MICIYNIIHLYKISELDKVRIIGKGRRFLVASYKNCMLYYFIHFFLGWICDNKGVAIYLDWLLECLFRYRFVTINHHYQIMKLNSNLVEYVNMNQGLFEFEFN